ncbi:cytochrome P450 82A4 [Cajanus cajan]|uniref:Cytochrome P450 82A4 n=1 Tax=Cajanus cajan TaxID=3821 RepID=A0A151SFD7_CAJCA|nr:cytochrome P450 82A4 [Cajanus cajan]KYP53516.1 Cytochrome P450 82A4 [Cajanus cajan]
MDIVLNYLNATAIGLLSLFLFLFYLFLYHPFKFGHNKEAPTVAGAWPILGHLPLLSGSQSPHRTLGALADKYGPIFTIKLGVKDALIISNWEVAKECFTKNDAVVSSRPKLVAVEHLGYNQAMFAVAPYGPYWREIRKIITSEILSNRRVEQLQHVRVTEIRNSIKELLDVWSSTKSESGYALVELKQWFSHLVFNIVFQMTVGKRYFGAASVDDEKAQRCVKAVKELLRLFGVFTVGDAIPYLRWFDFGGHEKAMKEIGKEFDGILSEWLEEHRQKRALGENVQDFMDVMISLLDGKTIDGIDGDTMIKSTVQAILSAGTDTISTVLIWSICLILKNPLILEKLIAELDIQVGKKRCICESDLSKLTYFQATVKETLRLYPPAPLSSPREFTEDCTLSGFNVKKGTRLITNLWKINTDLNVWSDPLEFKPERFLTTYKDIDMKGQHFELLPFGSGRRICPGITFGLQIVQFSLAILLHSFEILESPTEPIDMAETFGTTSNKANPLKILIKPRLSPNCYESL